MSKKQMTYLGPFYILGNDHEILPCPDHHVFAKWFVDITNRLVAKTHIQMKDRTVSVSTVFIGVDKHFDREGIPRGLFETLISDGNYYVQRRCSDTWAEAEKMHASACKHVEDLEGVVFLGLPEKTK